jgi:hypothetical protein
MSKIFCAVKKAVDEWNPYSLLPLSPDDEFDVESKMISTALHGLFGRLSPTAIARTNTVRPYRYSYNTNTTPTVIAGYDPQSSFWSADGKMLPLQLP